jgi:hypothetical protein
LLFVSLRERGRDMGEQRKGDKRMKGIKEREVKG